MFNKLKDWWKNTFGSKTNQAKVSTPQKTTAPSYKPQVQAQKPSFTPPNQTKVIDATKTEIKPAEIKKIEPVKQQSSLQKLLNNTQKNVKFATDVAKNYPQAFADQSKWLVDVAKDKTKGLQKVGEGFGEALAETLMAKEIAARQARDFAQDQLIVNKAIAARKSGNEKEAKRLFGLATQDDAKMSQEAKDKADYLSQRKKETAYAAPQASLEALNLLMMGNLAGKGELLGRAGQAAGYGMARSGAGQLWDLATGKRDNLSLQDILSGGLGAASNTGLYAAADVPLNAVLGKLSGGLATKAPNAAKFLSTLTDSGFAKYSAEKGGHLLTDAGRKALVQTMGKGALRGLTEAPLESVLEPIFYREEGDFRPYGERYMENLPSVIGGNTLFGMFRGLKPGLAKTKQISDAAKAKSGDNKLYSGVPGVDVFDDEIRAYAKELDGIDLELKEAGKLDAEDMSQTDLEKFLKQEQAKTVVDDTKTDLKQEVEKVAPETSQEKYRVWVHDAKGDTPYEFKTLQEAQQFAAKNPTAEAPLKAEGGKEIPVEAPKAEKTEFAESTKIKSGDVNENAWQRIRSFQDEPARRYQKLAQSDQDYKLIEDTVLRPRAKAAADTNRFIASQEQVLKDMGFTIKEGSKDSKLMGEFLQGKMTAAQIRSSVGDARASKILSEAQLVKPFYRLSLKTANEKIVANGGKKIADFGEDYLRGYFEGSDLLDPNISGKSTTGAKSLYNEKTGKGGLDVMRGINDWNKKAADLAFFQPVANKAAELSAYFQDDGQNTLSKYLAWQADEIAGIKKGSNNPVNKILDKLGMGLFNRSKGAKVSGNIGTIAAQPASMILGTTDAGAKNIWKGGWSKTAENYALKSDYLEGNKGTQLGEFEPTKLEKLLSKPANFVDYIGKKIVWKGEFAKALSEGKSKKKAFAYAEKQTPLVMGDRTRGSFSQFNTSTWGRILAPFTTEVQTQANQKLDVLASKDKSVAQKIGYFTQIIGYTYLYNSLVEFLTGLRPGNGDYINAAQEALELATGSDKKDQNIAASVMRIASEVLDDLSPAYFSMMVSATQLGSDLYEEGTGNKSQMQDWFGSADPTRFGSAYSMVNPFNKVNVSDSDALNTLLGGAVQFMPGGNQLRKTLQGFAALKRGAVESKNGKVMFETPKGIPKTIQQLVSGVSSTSEARDYYDNDYTRPLSNTQTEAYYALPESKRNEYYNSIQEGNIANSKVDSQIAKLEKGKDIGDTSTTGGKLSDADKKLVKAQLEGGIVLDSSQLNSYFFEGLDATSDSVKERKEVYSNLKKAIESDNYTDEQKQAILAASGASEDDYEYYALASLDSEIKLQDVIIPEMSRLKTDDEVYDYLYQMRKEIGNKRMVNDEMLNYLRDRGYISSDMAKALKKVQYDEIEQEFWEEESSGSGSGSSYAKKMAKASMQGYKDLASLLSGFANKGGIGNVNTPVNYSQYANLAKGGNSLPNEVYRSKDLLSQILSNTRQKQDGRLKITG